MCTHLRDPGEVGGDVSVFGLEKSLLLFDRIFDESGVRVNKVLQGWGWFLQKLCQRHGKYLLVGAQYFVGAVLEDTDFSDELQSGFVVGSRLV